MSYTIWPHKTHRSKKERKKKSELSLISSHCERIGTFCTMLAVGKGL